MKIVGVSMINALGRKGPEDMASAVFEDSEIKPEIWELDNSNIEESQRILKEKSGEFFSNDNKFCFVGGDHSITYPIFSSFKEKFKDAFLIVMDAHADCMPPMREPTHEEFLRAIIESGFSPEKVILVGARKIEPEENNFLKNAGIKVFGDIQDFEAATDYITEKAMGADVYISIDIDVLDPAFAPAVNYLEVGGMTSKDFFYMVKRFFKIKTLRAIDIVEAIPKKDERYDNRTIKLCSKIIEEFSR